MKKVAFGIFAHNERDRICTVIAGLSSQDILQNPGFNVSFLILANGCTDSTAQAARACVDTLGEDKSALFQIFNLAEPGKSRTWNRFVHELADPEADIFVFCDGDIILPSEQSLNHMCEALIADPLREAVTSRPVKDSIHRPTRMSLVSRLIAAGGGTLDDWRSSICGQLYALKGEAARSLYLPIGLPVEDGFVRAMILTNFLKDREDLARIYGDDRAFHVYESERTISALIRHQVRIVVGGAINTLIFSHLSRTPFEHRETALRLVSTDENWVTNQLVERLPKFPYGWIPTHFLTKRLVRILKNPRNLLRPKAIIILIVGLAFDLVVYCCAQVRMARGVRAGFW